MIDLGMNKAKNVIVCGDSTGSIATLLWVDFISDRIKKENNNTKVLGIPDWLYSDFKNIKTGNYDFRQLNNEMLQFAHKEIEFEPN